MLKGTVKWFNPIKGYGFIQPDEGAPDVFVHANALQQSGIESVQEGQRLSYEIRTSRNGKDEAHNLAKISE
mgnify:CR=1 FL=1